MGHGILQGVRVLDQSTTFAGALATRFLGEQGADVVALVDQKNADLMRNKRLLRSDDLKEAWRLGELADVVVHDDPTSPPPTPLPPHQILCLMTPFSPRDQAMAHLWVPHNCVEAYMGLFEPPVGRHRPTYTDFPLLGVATAAHAATAILGALVARGRGAGGQQVEVAQADVAWALLELGALLGHDPPKSWPTLQWASTPFISRWRTMDRQWIYVHAGLGAHARGLKSVLMQQLPMLHDRLQAALGEPVLQEPTALGSVRRAVRVHRALRDAFASKSRAHWLDCLGEAGLCAVPILSPTQWAAHPVAQATMLVNLEGTTVCRRQVEVDATPPPPLALLKKGETYTRARARFARGLKLPAGAPGEEVPEAPLQGIRVLDLTQVIAGPVTCRELARMGATVHKVINPHFEAPWVQAFRLAFDPGKQTSTLDLKTPQGRRDFWALVRAFEPEVVVHNFRPGVATTMGLTKEAFESVVPKVILTHLSAYGTEGTWGSDPGWEQTAQAVVGMQQVYGGASPRLFPMAINDLCTGVLGTYATLLALFHKQRTGQGATATTSLLATATLFVAREACGGPPLVRGAKALGARPLHHFYRTQDGWLLLWVAPGSEALLGQVQGLERWRQEALPELFGEATTAQWQQRFAPLAHTRQCAVVPRRPTHVVLQDQQALAAGLVERRHHPGLGGVTQTQAGWRMLGTPFLPLEPASGHAEGTQVGALGLVGWAKSQAQGAVTLLWRQRAR